jgi:hypothetical protein
MIGQIFGRLSVISKSESYTIKNKNGKVSARARWLCQCSCGLYEVFSGTKLRRGINTKCKGCAYRERPQSIRRLTAYQRLFNLMIRDRARKAGLKVELTLEDYKELVTKRCAYCKAPPKANYIYSDNVYAKGEITYAHGIDRVNNRLGYLKSNCVPCCKTCNMAKHTLKVSEFKKWIRAAYKNYAKE